MPPPKRIDTEARIARSIPRKLQEQIWVIQSPARTLRIGESRLTRNDQTFIFFCGSPWTLRAIRASVSMLFKWRHWKRN